MSDPSELLPILLALIAAGLTAGVIAGLLGVGGGIVLVPVLDLALPHAGVPVAWSMHVAVATSRAGRQSISRTRAGYDLERGVRLRRTARRPQNVAAAR
jgi:uncharacterized protein